MLLGLVGSEVARQLREPMEYFQNSLNYLLNEVHGLRQEAAYSRSNSQIPQELPPQDFNSRCLGLAKEHSEGTEQLKLFQARIDKGSPRSGVPLSDTMRIDALHKSHQKVVELDNLLQDLVSQHRRNADHTKSLEDRIENVVQRVVRVEETAPKSLEEAIPKEDQVRLKAMQRQLKAGFEKALDAARQKATEESSLKAYEEGKLIAAREQTQKILVEAC
jgi:hypothetical protein